MSAYSKYQGSQISIEALKGGFVMEWSELDNTTEEIIYHREIFSSPRKLQQKLKDVISTVSFVSE